MTRGGDDRLMAGAQMGKMCVVDGDYAHGPLVLPPCEPGVTSSSFSLDLAANAGPPTKRARTDPSSSRSTRKRREEDREPDPADPRLFPPSRREGSAWRSPWRPSPGRNATGDWPRWSSSPRLERTRTARSSVRIREVPRTLAAARRGRHRHRGVARGPGRHVSDVRIAVGRRGVRPELRRRASSDLVANRRTNRGSTANRRMTRRRRTMNGCASAWARARAAPGAVA